MDTTPLCPGCGKPLAPNAPKGLCPECLMRGAFPTGTDAGEPSSRFIPPTVEELVPHFPQLEILEFIGQGGMGAVYKARQKQLDRVVALKLLPPGIGHDAAFAGRFAREAKALAKLNHPGIVTIYDFGRTDGLFYFLMEFVDGVTLRQLLNTSRVSSREALAIVPQICDALQFAHDQGIVHRDIKPENILLDRRGRVKVADFGLAKLVGMERDRPGRSSCDAADAEREPAADGNQSAAGGTPALRDLTGAGNVMGTPNYMAPEQIEHPGEVDHRADIYALGVVFYQMLTGELPGKRLEPPSSKVQIDVRLDEVVLRALERKPELRYQQVSEVKTVLETIATGAGATPAEPVVAQNLIRILFDFSAGLPLYVEREGRRRLHWPGVLLFGSTIGFVVNGTLLAIGLALWLLKATPPNGNNFATPGDAWRMFLWLAACAVMRLAALKLGSNELAGSVRARAAKGITVRKMTGLFLAMMVAAATAYGLALLAGRMRTVSTTAFAALAGSARFVAWVALSVAVGWYIIRRSRHGEDKPVAAAKKTIALPSTNCPLTPEAWLAVMDGGNYPQSWETAAASLQRAIGKEEWVGRLEKVRRPLGVVLSRKLSSTEFTAAGTHFVAKYDTSFDGLPAAIETVTYGLKPGGEWKPVGCLVKPAGVEKKKPGRFWKWFGVTVLTLVAILSGLVLVGIVIPNIIQQRKMVFVQQQQAEIARKFGPVIKFTRPANPVFGPVIELTLPIQDTRCETTSHRSRLGLKRNFTLNPVLYAA